jgi:hypothetical protein
LRSIIVNNDGTTIFKCDGLSILSNVVWSERDNTLILSNAQSVIFVVGYVCDWSERSNREVSSSCWESW